MEYHTIYNVMQSNQSSFGGDSVLDIVIMAFEDENSILTKFILFDLDFLKPC